MIKCILVDFDNTLTTTDSMKFLLESLVLKRPFRVWVIVIGYIFIKFSSDESIIQKWKNWIIINLIRGRSNDELSRSLIHFRKKVSKVLNENILLYMRKQRDEGYYTTIVTASPEFAIRSIPELAEFKILGSIFWKNKIKNSCFGEDKVKRIMHWQNCCFHKIRFVQAWSDSLSDLPMMNLAEKKYGFAQIKTALY